MDSSSRFDTAVSRLTVAAFTIPTDAPESDGTLSWKSTTLVLVQCTAGGVTGIGYTYADTSTGHLIADLLAPRIEGGDAMNIPDMWDRMFKAVRNLGRPGIAAMAVSAVDSALWDLKARLLGCSILALLGAASSEARIYGSGGFTSYSIRRLQEQLSGWVDQGIPRVKMKIGSHPAEDTSRVEAARAAIGLESELYVDANGAYGRKQALALAERFRQMGVVWFEEPVPSDDLVGLHLIRDHGPAGMSIAAGEYGYELQYFRRMLEAGAVDVLQADCTRCGGVTGFMGAATIAHAHHLRLSAHCAPSLHAPLVSSISNAWPMEYFHDHVRIEHMLFDGVLEPVDGFLRPDRDRHGFGLELKWADAEPYRVL